MPRTPRLTQLFAGGLVGSFECLKTSRGYHPLQAQPLPFRQTLSREMQLSPHALPALQVLQQAIP